MFARRTSWQLAPNLLTIALEKHRSAKRELLDLTASNPTECGLEYDQEAILAALADVRSLDYHPEPKGLLSARVAVAKYYREAGNVSCTIDPEQVFLTTSTSEAYSFIFRLLCDPGDEVLVPTPSYPLFEFLAGLQDVRLAPYSLVYDHGWQIDFHSLETAITPRTRAVIVVHPNNPTGSFVKPHEVAALNAVCTPRELALVVDEVFLDYTLSHSYSSFAINDEALTFTLSGISKISGLPQMKLAWLAVSGPGEMARQAVAKMEVIADTYLSMNTPIQLAAPILIEQRRGIQKQLISRAHANLMELDQQLGNGTIRRLDVEGGWYAVLRVPVTRTDEALTIELLEKECVLVQPGYFYDFWDDGYLVVSLITPGQEFREGLRRMLRYLKH